VHVPEEDVLFNACIHIEHGLDYGELLQITGVRHVLSSMLGFYIDYS